MAPCGKCHVASIALIIMYLGLSVMPTATEMHFREDLTFRSHETDSFMHSKALTVGTKTTAVHIRNNCCNAKIRFSNNFGIYIFN